MLNSGAYFVAGTDTGVGKTLISAALLTVAARQGWSTQAFKPVAAGCEFNETCARWENEDAQRLMRYAQVDTPYEQVNPCALPEACSPHIAAQRYGWHVNAKSLVHQIRDAVSQDADVVLAEGAGGWFAPVNEHETMADVALGLGWPVILVVGVRLGCLNHAVLTHRAIASQGLPVAGWIACQVEAAMPYVSENVSWLKAHVPSPLLALVPWLDPVLGRGAVSVVADNAFENACAVDGYDQVCAAADCLSACFVAKSVA